MKARYPFCNAYLNFRVILRAATTFNMADYAEWVRDHQVEISVNYAKSDEDDPAVYARMQYARSIGIAV